MNLDPFKLTFFTSWCLSLALSGIRIARSGLYALSLISAGASLFLDQPQYKALGWFSGIWVAYLIAATEGSRLKMGVAQKYFFTQIFGALIVVMGIALSSVDPSLVLVLVGGLCVIPSLFHSLFFSRFYESITRRAYLFGVLLPALVGVDLLFSMRVEIKQAYPLVWQYVLFGFGSASLLVNSFLALIRPQTRTILISLSQAWLGVLLVLMASDDPNVILGIASILIMIVNGFMLYLDSKNHSRNVSFFVITVMMGAPVFVGFNALYYSMKALESYSPIALVVFLISMLAQTGGIILNLSRRANADRPVTLRFVLLCGVSLLGSIIIHMMGMKNALG